MLRFRSGAAWRRALAALVLLPLLAGCGAWVEQTIELDADGGGRVVVVGTLRAGDVDRLGADRLKQALLDRLPAGWQLETNSGGGLATFRATAIFHDADELRQRLVAATGERDPIRWVTTRTPFYQKDELQSPLANTAWARWAAEALSALTAADSPFDSVRSYVQWPGEQPTAFSGNAVREQRSSVAAMTVLLRWSPAGLTRTIDLTPGDRAPFMSVPDWLRRTLPGAQVSADGKGRTGYHIVLPEGAAPWGGGATAETNHVNWFWDRTVVHEPAPDYPAWLGSGVPIEQLTLRFDGPGWWDTRDRGTPDWRRWPAHHSALTLDHVPALPVTLVGYRARPALYLMWVLVPVLGISLLLLVPLGVRRARRRWEKWSVSVPPMRGTGVAVSLQSRFCPECGQPADESGLCAAGHQAVAAGVDGEPVAGAAIAMWATLAWRRFALALWLHAEPLEMPWQAAALSLTARVVAGAFLVNRWLNALVTGGVHQVYDSFWLFRLAAPGDPQVPTFWWLLLAFAAATGLALLAVHFLVPRVPLAESAATLSDAQWPATIGVLAAWLLGSVSAALSVGALAASLCWGQAVLASGLARFPIPYRRRVQLQALIGGLTVAIIVLILGPWLQNSPDQMSVVK